MSKKHKLAKIIAPVKQFVIHENHAFITVAGTVNKNGVLEWRDESNRKRNTGAGCFRPV